MAAACGTCAICLSELHQQDEAFLDECWHHFHLQCIKRWADSQLEGAGGANRHATLLACPLCRRPFASAIYDCHDTAYRRHYFEPAATRAQRRSSSAAAAAAGSGSLPLTAAHRRRRSVYSTPLEAAARQQLGGQLLSLQQVQRPAVEAFVTRELEALMLQQDVGLVAQHVLGTLHNAVAAAAGTAASAAGPAGAAAAARPARPRLAAAQMPARGSSTGGSNNLLARSLQSSRAGALLPDVSARLRAAAAPFLFENAERFAWEVAAFAASACASLAAYDRQTLQQDAAAAAAAGAAARRQLVERDQHAGAAGKQLEEQSARAGGHSSSSEEGGYHSSRSGSSSDEERGGRQPVEPQRSDSEGYLGLLLMQGSQRQRRGGSDAQPADTSVASKEQAAAGAGLQQNGTSSPSRVREAGQREPSSSGGRSGRRSRGQREGSPSRGQHRKRRRRRRSGSRGRQCSTRRRRSRSRTGSRGGSRSRSTGGSADDGAGDASDAAPAGGTSALSHPAGADGEASKRGAAADQPCLALDAQAELAEMRRQALLALERHRRQQEQAGQ